jgi:hypothetical protein
MPLDLTGRRVFIHLSLIWALLARFDIFSLSPPLRRGEQFEIDMRGKSSDSYDMAALHYGAISFSLAITNR